jgi:hypothetical protein
VADDHDDKDSSRGPKIPKLETDYNGTGRDNYGSWEVVTKMHFEYLGSWEIIEGSKSNPPEIPVLKKACTVTGTGPNGALTTIAISGNEGEIEAAGKTTAG